MAAAETAVNSFEDAIAIRARVLPERSRIELRQKLGFADQMQRKDGLRKRRHGCSRGPKEGREGKMSIRARVWLETERRESREEFGLCWEAMWKRKRRELQGI